MPADGAPQPVEGYGVGAPGLSISLGTDPSVPIGRPGSLTGTVEIATSVTQPLTVSIVQAPDPQSDPGNLMPTGGVTFSPSSVTFKPGETSEPITVTRASVSAFVGDVDVQVSDDQKDEDDIGMTVYSMTIQETLNGSGTPTNADGTQVVIGQAVALSVATLPSEISGATYQWTIQGSTFKSENPTSNSDGIVMLSDDDLTSDAPSFFWYASGGASAAVVVSINGHNTDLKAGISVLSPGAAVLINGGAGIPPAEKSGGAFQMQGIGIDLTAQIADPNGITSHHYAWDQTVNWSLSATGSEDQTKPALQETWTCTASGLDAGQFEDPQDADFTDAPIFGVDPATIMNAANGDLVTLYNETAFSAQQEFQTTLVYQPGLPGAAYVPIQTVTWSIGGADNANNVPSFAPAPSAASTGSGALPSWSASNRPLLWKKS